MSVHSTSSSVWQENKDLMCCLTTKISQEHNHRDKLLRVHLILTLVTVMKSGPKNTLFTPSISNRSLKGTCYHVTVQQKWTTNSKKSAFMLLNSVITTSTCADFYQECHWWLHHYLWCRHFYQDKTKCISKQTSYYLHNAFIQSVALIHRNPGV